MRISEAKKCIKELYIKTNHVSALISERGVGKTSAYQQCAEELGIGYMALYAAALEGPDFMGLPDKSAQGITRYLAPQFLPTKAAVESGIFPEKGIIVFEEINRVPSDTVSVLYPLLLEGRINNHSIVPGWKIGVTMNPDNLNYSVNALDDALIDRFISIEITPDLDDYIEYSVKTDTNDSVLSYLTAMPDMLLVVRESADSNPLSKSPTPRGWSKVQEILNRCEFSEDITEQLVSGIIGPQAAASFFGFLKTKDVKIPEVMNLLRNFDSCRMELDKLLENDRIDALNILLKKTALILNLSDDEIKNADKLIQYLPDEFKIIFFKYLATKRPDDFEKITSRLVTFESVADKIIEFITA